MICGPGPSQSARCPVWMHQAQCTRCKWSSHCGSLRGTLVLGLRQWQWAACDRNGWRDWSGKRWLCRTSLFKQRRRSWVSTVKWSQHCKVLAWETIEQRFSVFVQVRVEVCFSSSEELILATWCTLLSECTPSTQKGAWPTAHLKNVED